MTRSDGVGNGVSLGKKGMLHRMAVAIPPTEGPPAEKRDPDDQKDAMRPEAVEPQSSLRTALLAIRRAVLTPREIDRAPRSAPTFGCRTYV